MTRDAAEQSRRLALPQSAADVKLELPKDFQLPQGMEFKLDPSKPEYGKLQAAAVKHGLSPEAISDIVAIHAETVVGSETTISAAHQAEIAKLGANGPARVTALETFFTGLVGSDGAKQIKNMAVTASLVQALEGVAAKFASQGVASFSQAAPRTALRSEGFGRSLFENDRPGKNGVCRAIPAIAIPGSLKEN
jgi:hypothetical protein